MNLYEILDTFTSQQLGSFLSYQGESSMGTKAERIQRILGMAGKGDQGLAEFFDGFPVETIRDACSSLGLPTGRKAIMIEGLLATLGDAVTLSAAPAKVELQPASKLAVLEALAQHRVPRRNSRDESSAEADIAAFLEAQFEDVFTQYNVGGYFGLRIDLDIGNGKIGIELKLAESLLDAAQAQRLIGQAVYYQRRRYGENLIIGVVGVEELLRDPGVRETLAFLSELGISCVPIATI